MRLEVAKFGRRVDILEDCQRAETSDCPNLPAYSFGSDMEAGHEKVLRVGFSRVKSGNSACILLHTSSMVDVPFDRKRKVMLAPQDFFDRRREAAPAAGRISRDCPEAQAPAAAKGTLKRPESRVFGVCLTAPPPDMNPPRPESVRT
jgi:hypothetical protein